MAFPTTSPPSFTAPWQVSLSNASGNLILGGNAYAIYEIDGLLGMPDVTTNDAQRPRNQGAYVGFDVMSERVLTITGDVVSDGTSLMHAIQALTAYMTPQQGYGATEYPMWVYWPNFITNGTNTAVGLMVRPRKRPVNLDLGASIGAVADFTFQLAATDPRLYTAPVTTTVTASGGSTIGTLSCVNAGNYQTSPVLTFTGPMNTGWQFVASGAGTGTVVVNQALASGDTFSINLDTKVCTYTPSGGGATNGRSAISTAVTWPSGNVGTTTYTITAAGMTSSVSAASINYASAYLV